MNRKGQVEIGIGVLLLIGVLIMGAISSYGVVSENRYAVDESTKTIYDLTKCSLQNVDQKKLIFIGGNDLNGLLEKGYKRARC